MPAQSRFFFFTRRHSFVVSTSRHEAFSLEAGRVYFFYWGGLGGYIGESESGARAACSQHYISIVCTAARSSYPQALENVATRVRTPVVFFWWPCTIYGFSSRRRANNLCNESRHLSFRCANIAAYSGGVTLLRIPKPPRLPILFPLVVSPQTGLEQAFSFVLVGGLYFSPWWVYLVCKIERCWKSAV